MDKYKEPLDSYNLILLNSFYKDKIEHIKRKLFLLIFVKNFFVRCVFFVKELIRGNIRKNNFILKFIVIFYPKFIYDKFLKYNFDHSSDFKYHQCFDCSVKGRIAVYTSIFGNYDNLKEPLYKSDICDYYVITDMDVPPTSIWKKISIDTEYFSTLDNYHKSKYCKMKPHELFKEYEYSLWVDGNVQIVADVIPLFLQLNDKTMGCYENPAHDCIYTEAKYILYHNAANYYLLKKQINSYRLESFPSNFGMKEFSIIARKHSDKKLQDLMDKWWLEVNHFTMRDQISFPYILWKNGESIDFIQSLGDHWRDSPRFNYISHVWRHIL